MTADETQGNSTDRHAPTTGIPDPDVIAEALATDGRFQLLRPPDEPTTAQQLADVHRAARRAGDLLGVKVAIASTQVQADGRLRWRIDITTKGERHDVVE